MLEAYGWAIARSSREAYDDVSPDDVDAIDARATEADQALFADLQVFLQQFGPPDLDWHFRSHMNNASGILTLASSRNHRGLVPTIVEVLRWLAQRGPCSYGIVYLHDDEDFGTSSPTREGDRQDRCRPPRWSPATTARPPNKLLKQTASIRKIRAGRPW